MEGRGNTRVGYLRAARQMAGPPARARGGVLSRPASSVQMEPEVITPHEDVAEGMSSGASRKAGQNIPPRYGVSGPTSGEQTPAEDTHLTSPYLPDWASELGLTPEDFKQGSRAHLGPPTNEEFAAHDTQFPPPPPPPGTQEPYSGHFPGNEAIPATTENLTPETGAGGPPIQLSPRPPKQDIRAKLLAKQRSRPAGDAPQNGKSGIVMGGQGNLMGAGE